MPTNAETVKRISSGKLMELYGRYGASSDIGYAAKNELDYRERHGVPDARHARRGLSTSEYYEKHKRKINAKPKPKVRIIYRTKVVRRAAPARRVSRPRPPRNGGFLGNVVDVSQYI